MNTLTVSYLTSREHPHFEWFFQSLARQNPEGVIVNVIDFHAEKRKDEVRQIAEASGVPLGPHIPPKPTIWQGPHRITKEDWWAKSNALNTSIIVCETPWWSWVDDRCVLSENWLACVHEAMAGNYAVCGSYEKRYNMRVEDGIIVDSGELAGEDRRRQEPRAVPTHDWYGGHGALPLEWCLAVQGFSEDLCDSLGSEDSMFGVCLRNAGYPMRYDARMRLIEDRTQGQIDGALKRADKNSHLGRQAKSWAIVKAFWRKTTSQNCFDIRNVRDRVLLNHERLDDIGPFASDKDWYDGQKIEEMT